MLGMKILVSEERILFDQVLENIVADTTLSLRGTNSRFVKGLSDPFHRRPVDDDSVRRDAAKVLPS
jgi:hypothetical protein